ncbi:AzlC family ABC transporter permease [Pelobacter seleniigenes]|uniref:AzlC family ABC transporter permease n=1 Tax=Pelobacter seleniigenes TaxID=407188 RepID=UPI00055FE03A|nr:AzlC family ABC transporter permease [Pelobacter seleniigenes]
MTSEFFRGVRANGPVAASAMAYGSVFGVLASQKGLSWVDLMFMNSTVFAGAAQFVMVDMWSEHLPIIAMALTALVINLRYLLIGASLEPLFTGKSMLHKACMMHLVADENWAVTMREQRYGRATSWFLFGGGVFLYLSWSFGSVAGLLSGGLISAPEKYALDFAFPAVFTALAVSLWRGKADIVPWLVSGGMALLSYHFLPGKWYIVIGGLGGAIAAMVKAPVEAGVEKENAHDVSH